MNRFQSGEKLRSTRNPRVRRLLIQFFGWTSLSLILLSSLFAASPELHEWAHHETESESHSCVFSLFAKEQLLFSDPGILLPGFYPLEEGGFLRSENFLISIPFYFLPPGRGPPAWL